MHACAFQINRIQFKIDIITFLLDMCSYYLPVFEQMINIGVSVVLCEGEFLTDKLGEARILPYFLLCKH